MYNYSYKITYNNISEKDQNEKYKKEILECFNQRNYNYEEIAKIQDHIFNTFEENESFLKLITYYQKNQTFIPMDISLKTCITLLFQFDYLFKFHDCLKDLNKDNKNKQGYLMNILPQIPYTNRYAGFGTNVGAMKSGYYHNILSNNTANIESNLFNIREFDLTKSKTEFKPSLNTLGEQTFFSKNNVFVPEPLVVQKNQRPVGPFSGV